MTTKKEAAAGLTGQSAINEELAHDSALESLQQEAEALEQAETVAAAAQVQTQAQAEADSTAADLAGMLKALRGMAKPAVYWQTEAQFMELWSDSTMQAIAEPLAEIMRRHGLSMGDMLGKYAPYIALGMAVAPPALATLQGYKIAQLERSKPKATGGADAQS